MSLLDTIAALHAELDANHAAHDTRLILADALEEASDPRADGYRALGRLRKYAKDGYFQYASRYEDNLSPKAWVLPSDWYRKIPGGQAARRSKFRREGEDVVALAFSLLPADRRAQLLQTPVPA